MYQKLLPPYTVLVLIVLLLPALCSSQDAFICSRATYYGSPDCLGTPRGACGYGEFGRDLNGGEVGAVAKLYRNGAGCGGCYQVRCTNPELCDQDGLKIVVTDYGEGDRTDFILSPRAYNKLAAPKASEVLFAFGVVDVEYRRIPCQYPGYNLVFKVHEHSKYPDYLAIIILYQAGQKDITALELWQEDCKEWRGMRRAYGGVWDMASPPRGNIDLRFQVSGEDGTQSWVELKSVIPSEWKAGATYDSSMQLS
ncbi:hypothetical protein H6P81_004595 [Aristolochia fimbriata]|uniref:Expansin-like B1 n=1 Tax=Aristolochia fimbriata TaxID=158543 RepID=A0AAV7EV38_ARIFI|nr:hypothetical protein H6P81_004595 [Aristolochia fimbriata]